MSVQKLTNSYVLEKTLLDHYYANDPSFKEYSGKFFTSGNRELTELAHKALRQNTHLDDVGLYVGDVDKNDMNTILETVAVMLRVNQALRKFQLFFANDAKTKISEDDISSVLKSFGENRCVTHFDYTDQNNRLPLTGIMALIKSLKGVQEIRFDCPLDQNLIEEFSKLRVQKLSLTKMSPTAPRALANALQLQTQNKALTFLKELSFSKIDDPQVWAILDGLGGNKTLSRLNFFACALAQYTSTMLAPLLSTLSPQGFAVTYLSLDGCKLSDSHGSLIASALKINRTLTYVNLSHNRLGSMTAKKLDEVFQTNNTLKSLHLEGNDFKLAEDREKLFSGLAANHTLTDLTLGSSWEETQGPVNALSTNLPMKQIRFVGSYWTTQAIQNLTEKLQKESAVKTTIIFKNIRFESIYSIGRLMKVLQTNCCPRLVNLDFTDTPIKDIEGEYLVTGLLNNRTLRVLCLTNTNIGVYTIINLSNVLKGNTSLTRLYLKINRDNFSIIHNQMSAVDYLKMAQDLFSKNNKSVSEKVFKRWRTHTLNLTIAQERLMQDGPNLFEEKSMQDLGKMLRTNKTLASLHLWTVSTHALGILATDLEHNTTLTECEFSQEESDSKANAVADTIKSYLERNQKLAATAAAIKAGEGAEKKEKVAAQDKEKVAAQDKDKAAQDAEQDAAQVLIELLDSPPRRTQSPEGVQKLVDATSSSGAKKRHADSRSVDVDEPEAKRKRSNPSGSSDA